MSLIGNTPEMDDACKRMEKAAQDFVEAVLARDLAAEANGIMEANRMAGDMPSDEVLQEQADHMALHESYNLNPYVMGWVLGVEFTTTGRVQNDKSSTMIALPVNYQSPVYSRGLLETVLDRYKDQ
jgi:hypothetical protein